MMVSVKEHYEDLLSDVYTWLMGGFESAKEKNKAFFEIQNIKPFYSGIALDLGAGSGFQSIPLAELGYSVLSIDFSQKLLAELKSNAKNLPIQTINDNILNFPKHTNDECELIVCMTDTIAHLKSKEEVFEIFQKSFDSLVNNGKLILTFRDLSEELFGTDRFIPVRSDDDLVFTCFLEYETETVKIHDIIYVKGSNGWQLNKSCYRKVRLSAKWVKSQLLEIGFHVKVSQCSDGFVTIIAVKPYNEPL